MKALKDKIALVAGATRGAGRGIACMLGEAGVTVYCSGRSARGQASSMKRPETVEETAEMVDARGGKGIAVQTDHNEPEQVRRLITRIEKEQGRLDLLVNSLWGGDPFVEWGKSFWAHSLEGGLNVQQTVRSHLITCHMAAPLMIRNRRGLIVELTDGDTFHYRGNLFYDLVKISVIRMAYTISSELAPHGVTVLALTPGFLRSEAMLDYFGVTEANWQDGAQKDPHFIASETPGYVGRAVAALLADPQVDKKSGRVYSSWGLAEEYGFTDVDGRRPNWDRYVAGHIPEMNNKKLDDTFYAYWTPVMPSITREEPSGKEPT